MALLFMEGFDHYNEVLYGSMKWDNMVSANCTYYPTVADVGVAPLALVGTIRQFPTTYIKLLMGIMQQS